MLYLLLAEWLLGCYSSLGALRGVSPWFSFAREPQVLTVRRHRLSTNKVRWHACAC